MIYLWGVYNAVAGLGVPLFMDRITTTIGNGDEGARTASLTEQQSGS